MKTKTPTGKLMPIGGNLYANMDEKTHKQANNPNFPGDEILRLFLKESRNQEGISHIGLLLTPAAKPKDTEERFREVFKRMENTELYPLNITDKKDANNPETLKLVEKLTGIFITGGNQARLNEAVLHTELHYLLLKKYMEEDFIVAGSSAGAMCLSHNMIKAGAADEGLIKGEVEFLDGLGFIDNVIFDTHFHERGRWGRLLQAIMLNSDLTGIGLAADTAVLIKEGKYMTVYGSGEAALFEVRPDSRSDIKERKKGEPISVQNILLHTFPRQQSYELRK